MTTETFRLPRAAVVPDGPTVEDVVSGDADTNQYTFRAATPGRYRVWTSCLGGTASLYQPSVHDKPVALGNQQFEARLAAGTYVLLVAWPGMHGHKFRVHAARLGDP